jgi:hypothetical protein
MLGKFPSVEIQASVGLTAWLAWRSRGWPLIHDAPLMHDVAWLLAQGGRFGILRQRFLDEIGQCPPERGHVLYIGERLP